MATLADRKLSPRLKLMLIGPYKSWKTVNAHMLPRTRTLDFDDGMQSVLWAIKAEIIKKKPEEIVYETLNEEKRRRGFVSGATAFDAATDALDLWLKQEKDDPKKNGFDTLILDSASALSQFSINKALDENQQHGLSKSKTKSVQAGFRLMAKQDWGSGMTLFTQLLDQMIDTGKNVVLICHEKTVTDDEGTIIEIVPELIGGLKTDIPRRFDEIWGTFIEGTRNKPQGRIQTSPDSRRKLGSRLGCLDPVENFDFYAIRDKVAKFYGVKAEDLWTPGPK